MQSQQAPLIFTEAERPLGERLMKLALETDRVEGYTQPHAVMIARLSETIGMQMGLHGTDLSALKFAALAHDIGERGMKRNYLLQPKPLTWEEMLDLWRHPILGEQAAAELRLPRQTQLLVRWHHEWWNGQGYPDGLASKAIPLGARILRTVDTYCALISQRPHRQGFDLLEAEQIIADLAGIEFDPQVAKLLIALVAEERRQRNVETWRAAPEPEMPFSIPAQTQFASEIAESEAAAVSTESASDFSPEAPPTNNEIETTLMPQTEPVAQISSESAQTVIEQSESPQAEFAATVPEFEASSEPVELAAPPTEPVLADIVPSELPPPDESRKEQDETQPIEPGKSQTDGEPNSTQKIQS
jgi:hypothetical protein